MQLIANDYISDEVFDREKSAIFQRVWVCVGTKYELDNNNDYIVSDWFGKQVVVQNINGNLRAFENICKHRQSIIQSSRSGNRPLICPYHGWKYNDLGFASGIPNRSSFEVSQLCPEKITLKRFNLDVAGVFVFISVSCNDSLLDFLGHRIFALLEEISLSFGKSVSQLELIESANWKVAVENTLEFYHVSLIHRSSLARLGLHENLPTLDPLHSSTTADFKEKNYRRERSSLLLSSRRFRPKGYEHHFIFPNLTIATTCGESFSVQWFEPLSPYKTRFVSRVYPAKGPGVPEQIADAVALQASRFNEKVFKEDQEICELVQVGLSSTDPFTKGIISSDEARILGFHKAYKNRMES